MLLPLIPIAIGLGVSLLAGRKAHDAFAEHPDLRGFCSNCGKVCKHGFHESGMNWKKMGAVAVLLGAAGLGVSSLLVRNVYRCRACKHLVLSCRTPGCEGMALSGKAYDDEFCGECYRGNDKSQFNRAVGDREQREQLIRVLQAKQRERDALEKRIRELEADRNADKQLIAQLTERLARTQRELTMMSKTLVA